MVETEDIKAFAASFLNSWSLEAQRFQGVPKCISGSGRFNSGEVTNSVGINLQSAIFHRRNLSAAMPTRNGPTTMIVDVVLNGPNCTADVLAVVCHFCVVQMLERIGVDKELREGVRSEIKGCNTGLAVVVKFIFNFNKDPQNKITSRRWPVVTAVAGGVLSVASGPKTLHLSA